MLYRVTIGYWVMLFTNQLAAMAVHDDLDAVTDDGFEKVLDKLHSTAKYN